MKFKAQVATEYIILIGILLAILVPVLYYFNYQSTNVININQAQDSVQTLAKTADYVYSLGPGTRSTVTITIPRGAANSSVYQNELTLIMPNNNDIVATTKANLTGSFPYLEGTYNLQVTLLESGIVLIGGTCNNNGICDYAEDCSSCISDCGCSGSNNCCSGLCVIPQCINDPQCDDSNTCTVELCKNPNTCLASCTYTTINQCDDGDGCCPSGCTVNNDDDCGGGNQTQIICGDGICVAGELCYSCSLDCICGQEPPVEDVGTSLRDIGVDQAMYSRTDGDGLFTGDSQMAASNNITLEVLDDELTTPATTYVIRTRSGNKYESFNPGVEKESSQYTKVVLYGRVRIVDNNPFRLRIYPYLQNKNNINTLTYRDFAINDAILSQKVKWVELDITDLARTQDGYGFIKMRVTALNLSEQDNDRFQFSELHYKVG